MQQPSNARQLFDELLAEKMTHINDLVSKGQPETEWLDFKLAGHPADIKRIWSEAICGFANNQGGVIVWGVDARKDPVTGIDAASEIKPIIEPSAMKSRLTELLRHAVDPPILGVEIRVFHCSGEIGDGVVVCYIPEGDHKPYRAEYATGKPYVVRVSDSFQVLSTSMLRSLFYPNVAPVFEIQVSPNWTQESLNSRAHLNLGYEVVLKNRGNSSAKSVVVVVHHDPKLFGIETQVDFFKFNANPGYCIELSRSLHPRQSRLVARIFRAGTPRISPSTNMLAPMFSYLEINFDVFAENAEPVTFHVAFTEAEIAKRDSKTAESLGFDEDGSQFGYGLNL